MPEEHVHKGRGGIVRERKVLVRDQDIFFHKKEDEILHLKSNCKSVDATGKKKPYTGPSVISPSLSQGLLPYKAKHCCRFHCIPVPKLPLLLAFQPLPIPPVTKKRHNLIRNILFVSSFQASLSAKKTHRVWESQKSTS